VDIFKAAARLRHAEPVYPHKQTPLSGNTQKQLRLSSQADAARRAGMRPTEYTLMQNEARGIYRFPGSVCLAVAEAEPRVEAEAEAEPRAKSAA